MALVNACLKRINDENLAISLKKCKIAVNEIEWLGYKIDSSGYKPLESKVRSIIELPEPTTFRKLKQFMGAVQHMKKHIKSLAKLCAPLRNLLSKNNKFKWTEKHSEAFKLLKLEIANIAAMKHFDQKLPIRVICDASLDGLGTCLQQERPIHSQPGPRPWEAGFAAQVQCLGHALRGFAAGTPHPLANETSAVGGGIG